MEKFKLTADSVLNEYVQLENHQNRVILQEDSDDDDYGDYGLTYNNFQWCLKDEVERNEYYTKVFEGNKTLDLLGYGGYFEDKREIAGEDLAQETKKSLNNQKFRLPHFGKILGGESIVVSDAIFNQLELSKKLGATSGKAILHDPFGGKHEGYNYISFFNPLLFSQAEKRIQGVPPEKRPFLFVKAMMNSQMSPSLLWDVILIHKETIASWMANGYTGFLTLDEIQQKKATSTPFEMSGHEAIFNSLSDWQNNKYKIRSF